MGQKLAAHDSQGIITAFYDSKDSPPPDGAQVIEITKEEWLAAISTSGYMVLNGALVAPTDASLLAQARSAQCAAMDVQYAAAIAQDISFTTAAGVMKTYQADAVSRSNARDMIAAYTTGGVPTGFYWLAKDNTPVPFTLGDLQGLAKAMGDQGWAAFQRLQDRKASIRAASTVSAVQAIVW